MIEIRLGNVKYNFSKMDDTGMAPICRVQSWNLEQMQQERVIKALDVKLGPFQPGQRQKLSYMRIYVRSLGTARTRNGTMRMQIL